MAQELIRNFMLDLIQVVDLPEPIVEFGALQVEPETQDGDLRPLFAGRDFTGTDMRPGLGVDRVEDLRALSYADGTVGTAICLDTLEHCEDPLTACRELHRVVRPGGVCVIASVFQWKIHAYPNDYFRFTPEGFRSMLRGFDDVWVAGIGDPLRPVQVVGVAAKGRRLELSLERLPSLAAEQRAWDDSLRRGRNGSLAGLAAGTLVRQARRALRDRTPKRRG